jgi:hypothetical protein
MVAPNKKVIRSLLDKHGMNMREAADLAGLRHFDVKAMLANRSSRVRKAHIEALAAAFEISPLTAFIPGSAVRRGEMAKAREAAKSLKVVRECAPEKTVDAETSASLIRSDLSTAMTLLQAVMSEAERLEEGRGAASRYRELVAQFSPEGLSHQEALSAIRVLVSKAKRWDSLMRNLRESEGPV